MLRDGNFVCRIQHKVPSVSSSGSLGFIVCVKCYRMADSVPNPVANTVRLSVDASEMTMPA